MRINRLSRDFFERPTVQVAQDLLGKVLWFNGKQGTITETEAYIGQDDPACHAAKGLTARTKIMFGPSGFSYIYFIYGMYYCLNFVTEREGFPAAVLIRSLEIEDVPFQLSNGPGKLCRYLGLTKEHNGLDLITSAHLYVVDALTKPTFEATPRIGIRVGTEKLWRFIIKRNTDV